MAGKEFLGESYTDCLTAFPSTAERCLATILDLGTLVYLHTDVACITPCEQVAKHGRRNHSAANWRWF